MIIQADIKGLEVVIAAWLSQDKVLYKELNDGVDLHGENQRIFGFEERVTAKSFMFKLLYGAMEYGFANDPDMNFISTSTKYWKKIIDKFYSKYQGIAAWHEKICSQVGKTGMLTTPFGRTYKWDCMQYGSFKVPTTQVKNYPVQGTGADVVSIARVLLHRRWKKANISGCLINTVHDSIVADVEDKEVDRVVELMYNVFRDVPRNINNIFNVNFDLETKVEILVGKDMYNLFEVKL
jgi:DNA polymerase-1